MIIGVVFLIVSLMMMILSVIQPLINQSAITKWLFVVGYALLGASYFHLGISNIWP